MMNSEASKVAGKVDDAPEHPWLGYLLNRVADDIRTATATALTPFGLTPPMLRVLDVIAREQPIAQTRLGLLSHMDRTTIVHLVDRFETLGLARRTVHPSDRRSYMITLTTDGTAVYERAHEAARDVEACVLEPLASDDRQRLIALLQKLHQPKPLVEDSK